MAKHRKTRQEKILADHRHITYHLEPTPAQVSLPREKKTDYNLELPKTQAKTISYAYVVNDVRKTVLVTGSIIVAQIILFVIFNKI